MSFPCVNTFQSRCFICGMKYGIQVTIWSLPIFSLTLLKLNSLLFLYNCMCCLLSGIPFLWHVAIWLASSCSQTFSSEVSPAFLPKPDDYSCCRRYWTSWQAIIGCPHLYCLTTLAQCLAYNRYSVYVVWMLFNIDLTYL